MSFNGQVKTSLDAGNRSSIFASDTQDKRDLWWQAFRKTVLEPHAIAVLDNPMSDKVPEELLTLIEERCQNLDRHQEQALAFVDAVANGRGFDTTLAFPPEVVPALPEGCLSRCLDASFSQEALPVQEDSLRVPVFELPMPRPSLLTGFGSHAFSETQLGEIPEPLTTVGTSIDHNTGRIESDQPIYSPFLLFERTYGHPRHEIESATNYCAMDGAAALNAIATLYEQAWPDRAPRTASKPVVFSCVINNDLGIINQHWMSEGGFFAAPFCKFDFRDLEHFTYFLAWVEAIEEWATRCLLPDIQAALQIVAERKAAGLAVKALPSPVSNAEKQEKMSHAMREAFDNIPWKGERNRKTPLGVTSAMRLQSPQLKAESETVISPTSLTHPVDPTKPQLLEINTNNIAAQQAQPGLASTPKTTASFRSSRLSNNSPDKIDNPAPPSPTSTTDVAAKRKTSIMGLSLIRSAGFTKSNPTSPKEARPTTATDHSGTGMHTKPMPRPESSKSPGIITSTVEMKSPSGSFTSLKSKRSFASLLSRKGIKSPSPPDSGKRLKSPYTPDSTISPGSGTSKSKISSSLDMIKEHATPKRSRSDNSAPSHSKHAPPLPTPAYDKVRFGIKTPKPVLPEESQPTTAFVPPSEHAAVPSNSVRSTGNEAYNAKHVLPFRQYLKTPTSTVTNMTTVTAGA